MFHRGTKRGAEIRYGSGKLYRAPGQADLLHGKVVLPGKFRNLGHVIRVRAVPAGELFAAQVLALVRQTRAELFRYWKLLRGRTAAQDQGYVNALAGVRRADDLGARNGSALAARYGYTFVRARHGLFLLDLSGSCLGRADGCATKN